MAKTLKRFIALLIISTVVTSCGAGQNAVTRNFISNKSAFVSQFTLYGYLRTRMGGINFYKSLNDVPFGTSVNIARWNIYLVSVQDLLLFTFSYIYNKQDRSIITHADSFFKKILEDQLPFGLEIELKNKSIQEFDERIKKVNWHMAYKQRNINFSNVFPEMKGIFDNEQTS